MNLSQIDILTAGAALFAVWMCGGTQVSSQLAKLAAQTTLLAIIALLLGLRFNAPHYFWLAGVVFAVKAVAIPVYLSRTASHLKIRLDTGTTFTSAVTLLAGCGSLAAGYFLAPFIAVLPMGNAGAAGMALSHLLIGMLLMITRRLALSQVIGFLVLENGMFLYGLTQTHGIPLLVEMCVIFEILVGVMVAGLVIFRLNRSFEHIDVTQLRGLRH